MQNGQDPASYEGERELSDGSLRLTVPAGLIHWNEAMGRGWTPAGLADLVADAEVMVDAPNGMSPRCYRAAALLAAESSPAFEAILAEKEGEEAARMAAAEARRAAEEARLAAQMPRRPYDTYDYGNTVGRGLLKSRGWTDGHIERLLGEPDLVAPGMRGAQYLWGSERVEQAEATDERLQKRIASFKEKRAEAKAAAIESTIAAGKAVFRKRGDGWVLVGRGLNRGDVVTVALKDGRTVEKIVQAVIETNEDGTVVAVPVDERKAKWAREREQERATQAATGKREREERAAERSRSEQEARPDGTPPLPYGTRRNRRAGRCEECGLHVDEGAGALHGTYGGLKPDGSNQNQFDNDLPTWDVYCATCTWRSTYGLSSDSDPAPWVALDWTAADVRLAIAAGVTIDEAQTADPADPVTRAAWQTLAALLGTGNPS